MNSPQVQELLHNLEKMLQHQESLQRELSDYHRKMKDTIELLEREGLPMEFVVKFREEHEQKLSHYFDGLGRHLETESMPYTKHVIDKTAELLQAM